MADEVRERVEGDGYALAHIDALGERYGFRKIRRGLDVTAFGINGIVLPPGYPGQRHFHDEQEETYFVHRGRVEFEFGDGSKHVLGPGGVARVDPSTVRQFRNASDDEDAVLVIAGGKDGYVGRDGRMPEGDEMPRRPPGDSA
jgi:quercetin dioxygenase-like cupin family protein